MRLSPVGRVALLLLVLGGFIVLPALTEPIDRVAHDAGAEHVPRAFLFSKAISEGDLYPRWVQSLSLGLGDPLFTFNAPLPYYGVDLLYRLGLPHSLGWRVLVALGMVVGLYGAFMLVWELTRRWPPALVAGVAFLYTPYVNENFFDRGSNEAFGMMLFPWVIWGVIRVARRPSALRLVVAALLWALCIGSHVLAPLMLAPVAAIAGLALAWRYRTVAPLVALMAGGLLMAFVWAPILDEMANTRLPTISAIPEAIPADHPLALDRLLAPPAIYDVESGTNGQFARIGWLHALALALGPITALVAWRRRQRELAAMALGATLLGLLILWMLTAWGSPIWRTLAPLLDILEYRKRLLALLALPTSMLAGLLLLLLPERRLRLGAALMVLLLIGSALPSLYPELLQPHATVALPLTEASVREAEIEMDGSAFTAFGETHPRWLALELDRAVAEAVAASPLATPAPGVELLAAEIHESRQRLTLRLDEPGWVTLHTLYYPRWRATLGGVERPIRPAPDSGLLQVELPAGEGMLALDYATTPVERGALLLSGSLLLLLLGVALRALLQGRLTGVAFRRPRFRSAPPASAVVGGVALLLLIHQGVVRPSTDWFRCRSTAASLCNGATPVDVELVAAPTLVGYQLEREVLAPGETLRLLLTWEGTAGQRDGLWSFVHLRPTEAGWPLNPATGSDIWAQSENQVPANRPTGRYLPGRLYDDNLVMEIPPETPPGRYLVEIGWYDPSSGEQAEVVAESLDPPLRELWRSIVVGEVTVAPAGAAP